MIVFWAAAAALAVGVGCQPRGAGQADGEWDAFVREYIEGHFGANPTAAVNAGRHEFDGKLPDWSPEGLGREIERLRSARERATAFDAASLDEGRRFEREYLLAAVGSRLFRQETLEEPYKDPDYYFGALDPDVYVSREYAPLAERMRAYIAYAKRVPGAGLQMIANLRTPLPRTYAELGRNTFRGLASFYANDVPTVFTAVSNRELQAEFQEANGAAIRAARELEAWFERQRATATEDFALGRELFQRMLNETERVELPLDRLEEIGRADLERNLEALREACEEYAKGGTVAECTERVQSLKPQGGPVEGARRQLGALRAFVMEQDLMTIPGTEEALVAEAPPYQRSNFAYIRNPGPYETNLPSVYYIAPPDPSWSAADQASYIPGEADLLFTSVHEVWPGHFLQRLHRNRLPSQFAKLFGTQAASEGWAHYTEELMLDAGLGDGDPAVRIGQLMNALLRNVRYLSAIGLHTKGMTVEESERMFREAAYQDPGNARQQAARGTFDPGYLNYTLGKLMIRKLREDWTATRGGRAAWREFHDQFLSYGGPPIPLVRRAMLGAEAGPAL
jgi:uncharacterized protein (DUF885 family)